MALRTTMALRGTAGMSNTDTLPATTIGMDTVTASAPAHIGAMGITPPTTAMMITGMAITAAGHTTAAHHTAETRKETGQEATKRAINGDLATRAAANTPGAEVPAPTPDRPVTQPLQTLLPALQNPPGTKPAATIRANVRTAKTRWRISADEAETEAASRAHTSREARRGSRFPRAQLAMRIAATERRLHPCLR